MHTSTVCTTVVVRVTSLHFKRTQFTALPCENLVQKFSKKCGFRKDGPNDCLASLKDNKVYPCFSTNPVAVRYAASPLYAFDQCVISRNGGPMKGALTAEC